jgi:hypothetical protein
MAIRHHGLFRRGTPNYANAKAACYVYGTNTEGVDTGVFIEGEGVLFLSRLAVVEMAEVLGLSFNEEGQRLEEENAHLQHELSVVREERDAARSDLEAFGRAIARARGEATL